MQISASSFTLQGQLVVCVAAVALPLRSFGASKSVVCTPSRSCYISHGVAPHDLLGSCQLAHEPLILRFQPHAGRANYAFLPVHILAHLCSIDWDGSR